MPVFDIVDGELSLPEEPKPAKTKKSRGSDDGRYDELFAKADADNNLPPGMTKAIANAETGFLGDWDRRLKAVSPAGAHGPVQFMPATGRRFGLNSIEDMRNPEKAIPAAGRYLAEIRNFLGNDDPRIMAAAYNAGEHNKAVRAGRVPNNGETNKYVPRVMEGLSRFGRGMESVRLNRQSVPEEESTDSLFSLDGVEPVEQPTQQQAVPSQPAQQPQEQTPAWSDYAKQYAGGVAGIPEALAAGADMAGFDSAAKYLREGASAYRQDWRDQMTPAGVKAAETPLLDNQGNLQNWRAIPMAAAESAAGTIAMGGVGRAVAAPLQFFNSAKKIAPILSGAGLSPKVAEKVAEWTINGVAYGGAEGVYSGLQNAEQARNEVLNTKLGDLRQNPLFNELLAQEPKSGSGLERGNRVREKMADMAMRDVFQKTAISTGLIGAATGGGIFGQLESKLADGVAKRIVKGAVSEGLVQEGPQSFGESVIGNQAQQQFGDPNRGTFEGTLNDTLTGIGAGMMTGGPLGVFTGKQDQRQIGAEDLSDSVNKRMLELDAKEEKSPKEQAEHDFLKANINDPQALATQYGYELIDTAAQRDKPDTSISSTGIPGDTNAQDPAVASQTDAVIGQAQPAQAPTQQPQTVDAAQGQTVTPNISTATPNIAPEIRPASDGSFQIVDANTGDVISQHPTDVDAFEALDQLNADREIPTTTLETTNEGQIQEANAGTPGQEGLLKPLGYIPEGADPVIQPVPNGYQVVDANTDQLIGEYPTYKEATNAISMPAGGQVSAGTTQLSGQKFWEQLNQTERQAFSIGLNAPGIGASYLPWEKLPESIQNQIQQRLNNATDTQENAGTQAGGIAAGSPGAAAGEQRPAVDAGGPAGTGQSRQFDGTAQQPTATQGELGGQPDDARTLERQPGQNTKDYWDSLDATSKGAWALGLGMPKVLDQSWDQLPIQTRRLIKGVSRPTVKDSLQVQLTAKQESELRGQNAVQKKLGKPLITPEQFLSGVQSAPANNDQVVIDDYNRAVDQLNTPQSGGAGGSGAVLHQKIKAATTLSRRGFVQRRVAESVAKVFGHRVVFIEHEDGVTPLDRDGAIIGAHPDVILINKDSQDTLSRVVAHELTHGLRRRSPEIYRNMVQGLREVYSPIGVSMHLKDREYQQDLPEKGDAIAAYPGLEDPSRNEEEWVSDFVSDVIHKPMGLLRVAAAMSRNKPGAGARFLRHVDAFLTTLTSKLSGKGFNAEAAIAKENLQRARNAVTEALARYAEVQQTGVEPEYDGPEILESKKRLTEEEKAAKQAEKEFQKSGAVAGAKKDVSQGIAVTASYKPGKSYATAIYPKSGGNLTRLHERMLGLTRSADFDRLLEDIGLRTVGAQQTIRGMWAGEPEWTQLIKLKQLNGEPATFEQARLVANLLGWAAQQDAALTSMVVDKPVDGAYNIPSLYFGRTDGSPLTSKETDTALTEFAKVAFGASVTPDGKAVKFLFFTDEKSGLDEEAQYDKFLSDLSGIASSVGLDPRPEIAYTVSELDEFTQEVDGEKGPDGRGYRARIEEIWRQIPEGLQPGTVPGGIVSRAVDSILIPYLASVRAEGFRVDFKRWGELNNATKREVDDLKKKVEAYEAANRHGLVKKLRTTIDISRMPKVGINPRIMQKTTTENAESQLAELDALKKEFPKAADTVVNWLKMEAHAFGSNDVPIAPVRIINLMQNMGERIYDQISKLTPGQQHDADAGFANAAKFKDAYQSGKATQATTGKLLLWSFLSRGVSPYVQESMFIDSVRGIDPFIEAAAKGAFGPAELKEYENWAEAIVKRNGSSAPGNATKHNLNAFGKSFLTGMSAPQPGTSKTKLEYFHGLLKDPKKSGRDIRREFVKIGSGVGIDNKVISFTLLVTGRDDVLVLDRIQMRNLFNDGSFDDYNLYDGTKVTKLTTGTKENKVIHKTLRQADAETDAAFDERTADAVDALASELGVAKSKIDTERSPDPGTGLAVFTTGVRGLMLYEMLEDKLKAVLPGVYSRLGRPQDATPGRYHWESWVVESGQEASHGTLDALLADVEGQKDAFADVPVKQGEYGNTDYGVKYARDMNGDAYYLYPDSAGDDYRFSHAQWRSLLVDFNKIKGKIKGFKVSENADGTGRTEPWYNDSRVDRAKLDEAIQRHGTREEKPDIPASNRREEAAGSADAGSVSESGRVRGSDGLLAESRRPYQGDGRQGTTLQGLPSRVKVDGQVVEFAGYAPAQEAARRYMQKAGLKYNPATTYAKVDKARAKRIADAFDAMAHDPQNAAVKMAYRQMIKETVAQYRAILDTGLKIEFIDFAKTGDPYGNPRNAILDVVENNHLWVFSTRDGFGSNDKFDPVDNPLLQETEFKISGQVALANDLFRAVHDYFGHIKEGVGFRAEGEENAWRAHSAMYSSIARRAMTTETSGQNSWVNYGPFGEYNQTASGETTKYADQKIGLLPKWVSDEGATDIPASNRRPDAAGNERVGASAPAQGRPVYGQTKRGGVRAVGVHYSSSERQELDGSFYGTGAKGEEADRVLRAADKRLANRIYFYINAGQGVSPEQGVGGNAHTVLLKNLYDSDADPLELYGKSGNTAEERMNDFESAILDAGFDGYVADFGNQRAAVLIGDHKVPVRFEGQGRPQVEPGERAEPNANKRLAKLMGQDWSRKTPEAWGEYVNSRNPFLYERYAASFVGTGEKFWPDEMASRAKKGARPDIPASNRRQIAQKEYEGVVARHKGTDQWMKAPNGKPTNLTERQWVMVRTNSFKAWFGDWEQFANGTDGNGVWNDDAKLVSKVVDENGEPKIVYHGTKQGGFTILDPDKGDGHRSPMIFTAATRTTSASYSGSGSEIDMPEAFEPTDPAGYEKLGYEFEEDEDGRITVINPDGSEVTVRSWEKALAEAKADLEFQGYPGAEEQHGIYSLFLNIRNPYEEHFDGANWDGDRSGQYVVMDEEGNQAPGFFDNEDDAQREAELIGEGATVEPAPDHYDTTNTVAEAAKRYGSDGAIIRQVVDDGGQGGYVDADDVFVIFDAKQAKSATQNTGEFGPSMDLRFSNKRNPTFYSQLAKGFESSKMNSMPGSQWKAWLFSNKAKLGIKDDEIAWTGIEDFLTLNAKEKLTKAEIASYLADNGVQVQDVMKGEPVASGIGALLQASQGDATVTKFSNYTIPGGTNYRELLITLPSESADSIFKKWKRKYPDWKEGQSYKSVMSPEDQALFETDIKSTEKNYHSSHWYEPNVLAHLRFDERTDADGGRVMFITEIQSDWAQEGKRKGFGDNERLKEARKRHQEARSELANAIRGLDPEADIDEAITMMRRHFNGSALIPQMTDEIEQRLRPLVRTEMNAEEALRMEESAGPGVPKAPFVTDTKAWVSLALKRAIRHAAESGFDKIAFANGQQNADLYDLSKQVEYINYRKTGGDQYQLEIVSTNGTEVTLPKDAYATDELEDVVGKEIAQKIVNDEGERNGQRRTLRDMDLKVGGEGMRAFYDQIVPSVANDVLKKLGGPRVGTVTVNTGISAADWDEANSRMRRQLAEDGAVTEQPGFPVTPALQDKALSGMPLFSNKRNVLGQPALATWTMPDDSKLERWTYLLQDKHIDTKRVVERLTTRVADAWDPYMKETLYHGRAAKDVDDFKVGEVRPLLQAMSTRGITIGELETFLWNRHAPEANAQIAKINETYPDGGSGIKTQDALDYLANLPAGKRTDLEALAAQIDAITAGTRRLLVESGLETQDTIDAWEATYSDYIPLQRETDDLAQKGMGTGQGFSTKGSASKRRTGSGRAVEDILANVMMQRERAITRAEKNKVGLALYGLAIQNPNPEFWYPVNPDAVKRPAKVAQELANMGMLDTDLAGIIQEPTVAQINPRTGLVEYKINPLLRNRDNVLAVRIRGKDRFLFFSTENERAIRMAQSLKNLDSPEMHGLMNAFRMVTRYISSINTQYNPIFGAVNLIRDTGAGLLNLSTTPIAGKQAEVMAHIMPALTGIYGDLRADRKGKPRKASQWSQLWEEFQTVGGKTGYRDMYATAEERAKALESELKKIQDGTVKRLTRGLFDWLSDYNETLENAVRLSAYKAGVDSGMTKERAAVMAKELTVNFNRKGQVASQAGSLYAFFNAAVQGTARLAETVKGPAGKKIVAGGLLMGVVQAVLMAAAGYDDDEPPEFVRERNFIIPLPNGKYVNIPLPLGFHVIPNTSRVMVEAFMNPDDAGKKIAGLLGSYFEAFNPIGSAGWSVQTIAPTFADPLVALSENRDSFGKEIAKKDRTQTNPTPGFTRTKDTASWLSKSLAWGINRLTGGTDYVQGALSPTPDQLDFLFGQATGGVGREVMKIEQAASSWMSGEELPPYKYPLGVGRFVGDTKSQSADANRFYANITKLNELENEIKGRAKDGKDVAGFLRSNPLATLVPAGNQTERAVTALRSRKRKLIEQKAPKATIRALEGQIAAQMKALNDRVRSVAR